MALPKNKDRAVDSPQMNTKSQTLINAKKGKRCVTVGVAPVVVVKAKWKVSCYFSQNITVTLEGGQEGGALKLKQTKTSTRANKSRNSSMRHLQQTILVTSEQKYSGEKKSSPGFSTDMSTDTARTSDFARCNFNFSLVKQ